MIPLDLRVDQLVEEFTEVRYCNTCNRFKPFSDFNRDASIVSRGCRYQCKSCMLVRRTRVHEANPDIRRAHLLKVFFNITIEYYDSLLRKQGGVCAICKQPETRIGRNGKVQRLAVDHDHRGCPGSKRTCGECVRGLVCGGCNTTLAGIERVGSADPFTEYLKEYAF